MIVFDTDIISNLMRPAPSLTLIERLARTPVASQATTAITVGELAYGAARAGRPELFERAVGLLRNLKVLTFDAVSARRYGELRADLESVGRRLADADLRIAATVLSSGPETVLVTGNVRHFDRVPGLVVENWLTLGP